MKNIGDIKASTEARKLLNELKSEYKDGILLHLSGGCCDGSALLCYQKGDFKLGSSDILLGNIEDVEIYTHKNHYTYLQNNELELDIASGNGSEFSLEYGMDRHFVLNTKMCQK